MAVGVPTVCVTTSQTEMRYCVGAGEGRCRIQDMWVAMEPPPPPIIADDHAEAYILLAYDLCSTELPVWR